MKKYIFLLLLASCVQSEMITVTVGIEPDFKVTRHGIFELTASAVSDFDHVYDSLNFSATNLSTNKQTLLTGNKPEFFFAASPGTYSLYMGTKSERRIERYAHFVADNQNAVLSLTNKNLTLPATTKQGLILIVKSGVQSVPVIKCGGMTRTMWTSSNYYYAYIWDDGKGATISTTIGGVFLDNITIGVTKGVIYVFNPLGATIKSTDAYGTVQQI
jgi:hypothetical protein